MEQVMLARLFLLSGAATLLILGGCIFISWNSMVGMLPCIFYLTVPMLFNAVSSLWICRQIPSLEIRDVSLGISAVMAGIHILAMERMAWMYEKAYLIFWVGMLLVLIVVLSNCLLYTSSAIRNGKCVDTSMGLTPLEGLVMGTRSGDIDPAIIFHLHDTLGMSVDAINKLLTKESGLLGLTEVTSDCRYVEDNYATKEDAKRAMDVYCHRLAKYIGAYTALMDGRLDAVVFTGGIGENAAMVRELSLGKLGVLGFEVDHERNLAARFGKSGFINKEGTRPAVVIPTNEELVIAQDASRLTA